MLERKDTLRAQGCQVQLKVSADNIVNDYCFTLILHKMIKLILFLTKKPHCLHLYCKFNVFCTETQNKVIKLILRENLMLIYKCKEIFLRKV